MRLRSGCLLLISLYGLGSGHLEAEPRTPNIVVVLSDDFGYGSAGCYGADPSLIRTPNIDRLAREGRRFTDANTTSSVCSPTRYSVLTGRYCWRTSLKHEVLGTTAPLHIEPGRLNLGSLLKDHEYRTAAIGKWHLGYGTAARVDFTRPLKPGPLEIGFDYHFGVPSNHGDLSGVFVEDHGVYGLRSDRLDPQSAGKNFRGKPYLGLDAPQRVDEDVMPLLTSKAVKWLESQTADRPFFLYFTPVAVHNPVTPSDQTKGTSRAGAYGDWIHELDASVGRVLDVLDRKGFADDTLVLFTSDNGGVNKPTLKGEATDALEAGLKISGPFRGGKHDVWEGGFRVPYIVRWPGKVPAGTVCDETLSLVDTLATVAAVVGQPLPAEQVAAEDSYNMLPAWLGESYDRPIRSDLIVHSADGNFALRQGRWKWIEGDYHADTRPGALRLRADQFQPQLYDLVADRAETRNGVTQNPETAEQLQSLLARYRDGGFSRRLPPPSPPKQKPTPLQPITGKMIRHAPMDRMPESPWTQVRGHWAVRDGALRGSQKGGERIGAALRAPLNVRDGDIKYDVALPFATSHTLRLQCRQREHVFQVRVSSARLAILQQGTAPNQKGVEVLAEERLRLAPSQWVTVHVQFRGDTLAVQIGDTVVRTSQPALRESKTVVALMALGRDIGFRNVSLFQQSAGQE